MNPLQLTPLRTRAIFIACTLCLAAFFYPSLVTRAENSSHQAESKNAPSIRGIDSVLPENRSRLLARIKAYLQAEHNRDWATQYDLKAPEMSGGETKQAFITRFQRMEKAGELSQLPDFEVTDITASFVSPDHTAGSWNLEGCASYHDQYMIGNSSYSSSMEVRLRDNEWFIAGMGANSTAIDGDLVGCHFRKKRGILAQK